MEQRDDPEITTEEVLGWLEFGCWSALIMAPLIYWLQGPSVSTDQHVVRTGLIILAAVGGSGLRLRAWLQRRRTGSPASDRSPPPQEMPSGSPPSTTA